MPTRREDLERMLDDKPADAGVRLAYSDLLEELGEDALAMANRRLVKLRRHPMLVVMDELPSPRLWIFGRSGISYNAWPKYRLEGWKFGGCQMPTEDWEAMSRLVREIRDYGIRLFVRLSKGKRKAMRSYSWLYFRTQWDAISCLAKALRLP